MALRHREHQTGNGKSRRPRSAPPRRPTKEEVSTAVPVQRQRNRSGSYLVANGVDAAYLRAKMEKEQRRLTRAAMNPGATCLGS
jgi:hypothetical protein